MLFKVKAGEVSVWVGCRETVAGVGCTPTYSRPSRHITAISQVRLVEYCWRVVELAAITPTLHTHYAAASVVVSMLERTFIASRAKALFRAPNALARNEVPQLLVFRQRPE